MSEIKYMDIAEFRKVGFLQEVNRKVLHPCGLALEVETGPGMIRLSEEEIDYLRTIARTTFEPSTRAFLNNIVHRAVNAEERIGRVWDDRDDPEGIAYGEGYPTIEKAQAVAKEAAKHRQGRLAIFGGGRSDESFIVQCADGSDQCE